MRVAAHTADERALIEWPDDEDGRFARRYLGPILEHGTRYVAPNIIAELGVARVEGHIVPFTLSSGAAEQSYVVSPRTHYITYGAEEIGKLETPVLVPALRSVVAGLGRALDAVGFDDVVYVNNWLFSTCLYPGWRPQHAVAVLEALRARFDDRAICFRSIDRRTQPELADALVGAGCHLVFSRRVLYQDPRDRSVTRRSDYRKDAALLRAALEEGRYRALDTQELSDEQIARVSELYDLLYIEKWSHHNPQLEERYIRQLLRDGLLRGRALVTPEGRVDAVYAAWVRGRIAYVPVFGYDTRRPRSEGLYRMASALSSADAAELGLLIHDSAGVSEFKQNRGAVPCLEHLAVYDSHLPRHRRPFRLLGPLLSGIGVPIIERYDL